MQDFHLQQMIFAVLLFHFFHCFQTAAGSAGQVVSFPRNRTSIHVKPLSVYQTYTAIIQNNLYFLYFVFILHSKTRVSPMDGVPVLIVSSPIWHKLAYTLLVKSIYKTGQPQLFLFFFF